MGRILPRRLIRCRTLKIPIQLLLHGALWLHIMIEYIMSAGLGFHSIVELLTSKIKVTIRLYYQGDIILCIFHKIYTNLCSIVIIFHSSG